MIIVNSVLGVDTFLLLSGLLVAYVWLRHMEGRQQKWSDIPHLYVHRYFR
jgi:peptidoglycan/LPS O-acetylase OafA/YrhL